MMVHRSSLTAKAVAVTMLEMKKGGGVENLGTISEYCKFAFSCRHSVLFVPSKVIEVGSGERQRSKPVPF